MAITKAVPDAAVWVTGTNHYPREYQRWRQAGHPELQLDRVRDNTHDKDAVGVFFVDGPFKRQIGWVAAAQVKPVAQALDSGQRFRVNVAEHDPHVGDPLCRLKVHLYSLGVVAQPAPPAFQAPSPPSKLYLFKGEIGESSGHRAVLLQQGKAYRLRTTTVRASIDLIEEGGGQAGWIRKADIPYWNAIADRLDRFYAVAEGSALYLSEDLELLVQYVKKSPQPSDSPLAPRAIKAGEKLFYSPETNTTITKETTMNFNAKNLFSRLIDTNKRVAADAGYLEAGRLANNAVGNFLAGRLSWIERFFNRKHLQSPAGKLVIANGALLLAAQLRPDDARVKKLTEAMATQAYQELYQQVDIEGMIENLLASPDIKRALRKIDEPANTNLKAGDGGHGGLGGA